MKGRAREVILLEHTYAYAYSTCSLCLRLICWNALKTSWSTRFTAKKPAIKLSYLWLRRLVLLSTQKGLWERATLHPLPCRVESQWNHARTNKMMLRSDLQNDFVEFYQNTKMCLSQRNFTLLQNQAFGGRIHNSASLTIIFPGLERIFFVWEALWPLSRFYREETGTSRGFPATDYQQITNHHLIANKIALLRKRWELLLLVVCIENKNRNHSINLFKNQIYDR